MEPHNEGETSPDAMSLTRVEEEGKQTSVFPRSLVLFDVRMGQNSMIVRDTSPTLIPSEYKFALHTNLQFSYCKLVDQSGKETHNYQWNSQEKIAYRLSIESDQLNSRFRKQAEKWIGNEDSGNSSLKEVSPRTESIPLVSEELVRHIASNNTKLVFCGNLNQVEQTGCETLLSRGIFSINKIPLKECFYILILDTQGHQLVSKEINIFMEYECNEVSGEFMWTSRGESSSKYKFCFDRVEVAVIVNISIEESIRQLKTNAIKTGETNIKEVMTYLEEELGITEFERRRLNNLTKKERMVRLQRLWRLERMEKLNVEEALKLPPRGKIRKTKRKPTGVTVHSDAPPNNAATIEISSESHHSKGEEPQVQESHEHKQKLQQQMKQLLTFLDEQLINKLPGAEGQNNENSLYDILQSESEVVQGKNQSKGEDKEEEEEEGDQIVSIVPIAPIHKEVIERKTIEIYCDSEENLSQDQQDINGNDTIPSNQRVFDVLTNQEIFKTETHPKGHTLSKCSDSRVLTFYQGRESSKIHIAYHGEIQTRSIGKNNTLQTRCSRIKVEDTSKTALIPVKMSLFSNDQKIFFLTVFGMIYSGDLDRQKPFRKIECGNKSVYDFCLDRAPSSVETYEYFLVITRSKVYRVDPRKHTHQVLMASHGKPEGENFVSVTSFPDGKYAVGALDGNIKIYDPSTNSELLTFPAVNEMSKSLEVSRDGTLLLATFETHLRLIVLDRKVYYKDSKTNIPVKEIHIPESWVQTCRRTRVKGKFNEASSGKESLIVWSYGNNIFMWKINKVLEGDIRHLSIKGPHEIESVQFKYNDPSKVLVCRAEQLSIHNVPL